MSDELWCEICDEPHAACDGPSYTDRLAATFSPEPLDGTRLARLIADGAPEANQRVRLCIWIDARRRRRNRERRRS